MTKTDKLVAQWKKLHMASKVIEPQLEAVRKDVKAAIVATGEQHVTTALGTIALQTKTDTDWQGLARAHLAGDVIEAAIPRFQKTSEPFVRAPADWGAEAKAAAAKAGKKAA